MIDLQSAARETPRLRIGVLVDALSVANWEALILRQIVESPFCELTLFVVKDEHRPERSLRDRLRANRSLIAYRLYTRLDRRIHGSDDDAFASVDLLPEFAAVPRLSTVPLAPRRFEHRLNAETIAAIREADLDVILRFGFNIIRGEILEAARYGVWSFHHGDNHRYRGTPALFWEMYERNPVSGTILQRLTDELDGGGVLYRSWSATDPVSLRRGRNRAFWKSAHFVIRRLRDLHEHGWDYLEKLPTYTEPSPYDKPIYRAPTNRQTLRFLAHVARGIASRRLRRILAREQWFIAYRARRDGSPLDRAFLDGFEEIEPPADRSFADPFLLSDGEADYVLFEEYRHRQGKGVISCLALHGGSPAQAAQPVLERDHHLSYPFTFRWKGEAYMVPETSAARTIELYRAEQMPQVWVRDRILMTDVDASDTTIFHDGRLFWMFTSMAVPGAGPTDELFLFWAPSLDAEWTAHPMNPIVSDVRRARPAGRVFRSGSTVLRPAQDCSGRYGSAIVLHRVDVLTTTEYRETELGRLDGEWAPGVVATHTYDAGERYEVIDGLRSRPRHHPFSRTRS
jgi:hypothetical protein